MTVRLPQPASRALTAGAECSAGRGVRSTAARFNDRHRRVAHAELKRDRLQQLRWQESGCQPPGVCYVLRAKAFRLFDSPFDRVPSFLTPLNESQAQFYGVFTIPFTATRLMGDIYLQVDSDQPCGPWRGLRVWREDFCPPSLQSGGGPPLLPWVHSSPSICHRRPLLASSTGYRRRDPSCCADGDPRLERDLPRRHLP